MEQEMQKMDEAWSGFLENLWRRFESLGEYDRLTLQEAQQHFDETGKITLDQQARLNWAVAS